MSVNRGSEFQAIVGHSVRVVLKWGRGYYDYWVIGYCFYCPYYSQDSQDMLRSRSNTPHPQAPVIVLCLFP